MAYNNNDIIVIPDIHGRQFWCRAVELYPDADTIFLGDYHDPYYSTPEFQTGGARF